MAIKPGWVAVISGAIGLLGTAKLLGPARCSDGWASASIGRQGACSWHGGVDHSHEVFGFIAAAVCAWLGFTAAVWIIEWLERPERERAAQAAKEAEEARYAAALAAGELCPKCGSYMQRRTAKRGRHRGNYFMGCTRYPNCKTARPLTDGELARWGRSYWDAPELTDE